MFYEHTKEAVLSVIVVTPAEKSAVECADAGDQSDSGRLCLQSHTQDTDTGLEPESDRMK